MVRAKRYMQAALALVFGAVAFTSCSNDVTEVTENYISGVKVLDAKQKMPACDKGATGDILYVTDSTSLFYCTGKKWINMKSKDGKDGVDGQDGIDGENGKQGPKGEPGTSCTARRVANKGKTNFGVEVSCNEVVIDTLWSAEGAEENPACTPRILVNKDTTEYGVEMTCGGFVVDTLWGFIHVGGDYSFLSSSSSEKSSDSKENSSSSKAKSSSSSEKNASSASK